MGWGSKSGIPSNEHTCRPVPHTEYRNGKPQGAYYVCATCGRRM